MDVDQERRGDRAREETEMAEQTRRPIETLSAATIADLLERDGYYDLIGRENDIKRAAAQGSLVWTREHLKASAPSLGIEIDALPER